ncbi:MAG: glutathione S-transferase [Leptospiraceae bacterium]|nr:glutathione S-transferase [Leptospiraceae bacterium]
MNIILHEFSISHFSEKVRWALDYKRIPYNKDVLFPGLHYLNTLMLNGSWTVPILEIDGESRGESTEILQWLDELFPSIPLFPSVPQDRETALKTIHWLDIEIGVQARIVAYHKVLPETDFAKEILATGFDGWPKTALQTIAPVLLPLLNLRYKVNETHLEAQERTDMALESIAQLIEKNNGYIHASGFGACDITAASLLYPLFLPAEYPYPLPTNVPPAIRQFLDNYAKHPAIVWARKMYKNYR